MPQDSSVVPDAPVDTHEAHDTPHGLETGKELVEATPNASFDSKVELQHTLLPFSSESHPTASSLLQEHIPHNIVNGVIVIDGSSLSLPHEASLDPAVNVHSGSQVVPPSSIVPPSPRDSASLLESHKEQTLPATAHTESQSIIQADSHKPPDNEASAATQLADGTKPAVHESKMIFGQPANVLQRRRNYATTNAVTDYEADLTSKDRTKQKEAVKKYLMDRVRQDWTWEWPRPAPRSDESSPERGAPEQAEDSIFHDQWKERDEWLSNASESDGEPRIPGTVSSPDTPTPASKISPFRFESPDGVGMTIQKTQLDKKRRRIKRLQKEVAENEGLRCFVARRDAWTGARRVSKSVVGSDGAHDDKEVKDVQDVKDVQAVKDGPIAPRSEDGASSTLVEPEEEESEWEDEIEIPVAPSLIPPENAMRASILPAAYGTIYDKVVVQSLTPSCPMNLKDITRSCVQGWKRDGEWPPKSSVPEPKKKGRKMSIASLFGVEKHEKEAKEIIKNSEKDRDSERKGSTATGLRKSLQKILSLGHSTKEHNAHTNGNGGMDQTGKDKLADVAHVS